MKRIILFFLGIIMAFSSMKSENYPYRSDVLWVTVPDHDNWLYKTGEEAKVEIQFYKYGIPQNGVKVDYAIGGDLMPAEKKGSVVLKNGRASVSMGTMNKPGFRDCVLTALVAGKQYTHHVKVGFSPEKIQPYTEQPKDFTDFWTKQKQILEGFPLTYSMKKVDKYSTDKMNCFLVRLPINKEGQCVYAYLTKPVKEGKYPVVLCPPGAGVKTIKEPMRHRYYAENGCIRLEMEIHGLNPELDEDTFNDLRRAFNARENGYLTNNLDDKENYYMKHVYLACVRAIDFLTSLPEWDGKNVITQGGSQGGALALITAGLDSRVNLCVANHPALTDMAGFKANRADGYPHYSKMKGMDTPEKVKTMAYYDVVNFARQIKIPVYMTWGYNDNTCPPTTSYAVYNLLPASKEALITPINEHWTSENTERGHLTWILNHLR